MKFKCSMIGCNSNETEYYEGRWYCIAHYPRKKESNERHRGDRK